MLIYKQRLSNVPQVRRGVPFSSMMRFGSIALYGSPVCVRNTSPWSVQVPGSMLVDVASPIPESIEPDTETA